MKLWLEVCQELISPADNAKLSIDKYGKCFLVGPEGFSRIDEVF